MASRPPHASTCTHFCDVPGPRTLWSCRLPLIPAPKALSSSPKDPSSSRSARMEPAFPSKGRASRPASPVRARVAHCHLVGAPSLASPSATLWSSHHPAQSRQLFLQTSLKVGPLPFHPLLPTTQAGPLGHIHLGQPRLSLPIAPLFHLHNLIFLECTLCLVAYLVTISP